MTTRMIVFELLFVLFSVFTGYAVWVHGFVGVFEEIFSSTAGMLLFTDLAISLLLVTAWMWVDSRERGLRFLPYALVGLLFGSAGPLLYLIARERQSIRAGAGHGAPVRQGA